MTSVVVLGIAVWFLGPRWLQPRLVCADRNLELGVIIGHRDVRLREIPIKNTGWGTLRLRYLTSTCGCASVTDLTSEIKPGATGSIVLKVDPSAVNEGVHHQQVLLGTNDPDNKLFPIEVTWRSEAREDVLVSPSSVKLSVSESDIRASRPSASGLITIIDAGSGQLKVTNVTTSPGITSNLNEIRYECIRCDRGGIRHAFRIEYTLDPSSPLGNLNGWLKIETNHPDRPLITIPLDYEIKPNVRLEPQTITYTDNDVAAARYIEIISDDAARSKRMSITVTSDSSWIDASVDQSLNNRIKVKVRTDMVTASPDPTHFLKGNVRLRFGQSDLGEMVVPVLVPAYQIASDAVREKGGDSQRK